MPATLELLRDLGGSLRVLFVTPGDTAAELRTACEQHGWLDTDALWTHEAPLRTSARYPWVALLSAEGRVLLEGSALESMAEVRRIVEGAA